MGKRILISESEKNNIRKMYGLITEQQDGVIEKNVGNDQRLVKIFKDLEQEFNLTFTQEHFDKALRLDGPIKKEAGGLLPETLKAFEMLQKDCPKLTGYNNTLENPSGFRTYEQQAEQFRQQVRKFKSFEGAMKKAALPGFSQHHTGKTIDVAADENGDYNCAAQNCEKYGFVRPFMNLDPNDRMKEPWHLYYKGTEQSDSESQDSDEIKIQETDLVVFRDKIALKTSGQSLNLSSVKIDVDNKTFSVKTGDTQVYKLVLRWNLPNETKCASCENTISKNTEYGAKELKGDTFENGTRKYSLIVMYPKIVVPNSDSEEPSKF